MCLLSASELFPARGCRLPRRTFVILSLDLLLRCSRHRLKISVDELPGHSAYFVSLACTLAASQRRWT